MRICPDCSEGVELDSRFCPHCGVIFFTTLPQKVPPETENETENVSTQPPAPAPDVPQGKKKCPECGKEVEKSSLSCKFCGLIFFTKPAQPIHDVERPPVRTKPSKGNRIAFALLAIILILTIYYLPQIRWVFEGSPSTEPRSVRAVKSDLSGFDLSIDVQGRPSSLATNEKEFVLGNQDTGSFIRVSRTENQYSIRQQRVGGMSPLAWNGQEFVGYRESGFFQSFKKYFFTTHDSGSLNVRNQFPAPERIGGIAWDGSGYWAASRKENDADRGFIYRLDRNLKVVNKMVAPSSDCRGLAWDGNHLWFLNGNKRMIQVLDVKGIQAKTVGAFDIPLKRPSGIAFDGSAIWIADYGERRLMRLNPETMAKWMPRNENARIATESKKKALNNDEYKAAEATADNEAQITYFAATVESKVLYVTWDVRIDEEVSQRSSFSKLTITVDGGTLDSPVAAVFDAGLVRNFQSRLPVLKSVEPGTYHVRLFLYLQSIDSDGKGRIITRSIPPLKVAAAG